MAVSDAVKAMGRLKESGLDEQYEFEDPIEAWIDLCEACRIVDVDLRNKAVMNYLNLAKNSHWTHELMEQQILQDEDVDYAGDAQTESYSGGEDDQSAYPQQEVGEEMMRTCVTARSLGYTCMKCGVFVPTGQCHTCHL